jgi:hypothetical protein
MLCGMAAVLLIAGCNGGAGSRATEPREEEGAFDAMIDPLEKAKAVDAAAMRHKEDIDKALENAEAPIEDDGR